MTTSSSMPDAYAILADCLESLQLYNAHSDSVIFSDGASLCDLLESLSSLQLEERLKQIQYFTVVEAGDVERFQRVTASGQENLSFDDLLKIFMAWCEAKQQPSVCHIPFTINDVVASSEAAQPPIPVVIPSFHGGDNFALAIAPLSHLPPDDDFTTLNTIASPLSPRSDGPPDVHRLCDCAPAIARLEFAVSQVLEQLEKLEQKCEKKYDGYTRLPERHSLKFQHDRDTLYALDDLASRVERVESVLDRVNALTTCQGHADPRHFQALKDEILQVHLLPRCNTTEQLLRALSHRVKSLEASQVEFAGHHELLVRQQDTIGDRLAQLTLNSFSWEDWKQSFHGLQNYVEDTFANIIASIPDRQAEPINIGLHAEISRSLALDGQAPSDINAISAPIESTEISRPWRFLGQFSNNRWAVRALVLVLFFLAIVPFVWVYYPALPDRTPQPDILPSSSVGEGFMIQRDIYAMYV